MLTVSHRSGVGGDAYWFRKNPLTLRVDRLTTRKHGNKLFDSTLPCVVTFDGGNAIED
jgi:hypothetical protein